MDEADFLCDRIGIIDKGRIIALDTPLNLKASLGGEIIKVVPAVNDTMMSDSALLGGKNYFNYVELLLRKFEFVKNVQMDDHEKGTILIFVENAKRNLPTILRELDYNGVKISSVDFKSPTLNDVFLKYAGRDITIIEDHAEGGFVERYAQYGKK